MSVVTTVRMEKNLKKQLKILSAELGVNQSDLINKYVLKGIKEDKLKKKKISCLLMK